MRKWAFFGAAGAVLVAGCGGTGGGTHGGGTPVVPNNSKVPLSVRLLSSGAKVRGSIDVAFMTGQGQDTGLARGIQKLIASTSLTALIKRVDFVDNYGDVTNPLAPITACPLVGYQDNIVHLDADFPTSVPSRIFTSYNLDFYGFTQTGSSALIQQPATLPESYQALIRVFPGRSTSVPVFIDDSMFAVGAGNTVTFDDAQFQLVNGLPTTPITGFLSDLVAFNISGMSPSLRQTLYSQAGIQGGTGSANFVLFSGDKYAIADGNSAGSNIAMLTTNPSFSYQGHMGPAGTISGPGGSLPSAGTYSMLTPNPTDITEMAKIISLQGIWRDRTTVLTAPGGAPLAAGSYYVTFPDSNDDNMQEFVAFSQDGTGMITNLYFGFVDLVGTGGGPSFSLFPLSDLVTGSVAGVSSGTITATFTDDAQAFPTTSPDRVKNGNFKFTGTPPAGLANGTFRVFRL